MREEDKRLLEYDTYFQNSLPIFQEAFISYYGESERKDIEEKFKNALYIPYRDIDSQKLIIDDLEHKYFEIYLDEELTARGLMDMKELCFSRYKYELFDLMNIRYFADFASLALQSEEERMEKFIQEGFENIKNIKEDITLEEYKNYLDQGSIPEEYFYGKARFYHDRANYFLDKGNIEREFESKRVLFYARFSLLLSFDDMANIENSSVFKKLQECYECYKRSSIKYEQFKKELEPYITFVKEDEKINLSLHKTYQQRYIKDLTSLMDDDKKQATNLYTENFNYANYPTFLDNYGDFEERQPLIFNFSKQNEQLLNKSGVSEITKGDILRARVKYFKNLGINVAEKDLESLKNSEYWPSYDYVSQVQKIRDDCLDDFTKEYRLQSPFYQKIREKLNQQKFAGSISDSFWNIIATRGTFVQPNFIYKDDGLSLFPIVVLCLEDHSSYGKPIMDSRINHEFNHLYELNLKRHDENKVLCVDGFDVLTDTLVSMSEETEKENGSSKRKYEYFNEIINELLAQGVSKVMVDNNIGVFTPPDKARYIGNTSYENYRFLVQDFFDEYYETIIISRKKGNVTPLFQKVGQENFNKLNALINLFNQRFPSISFLNVRIALYEKKNNEDTRDYYKFVSERDKILESMREYSRNQSLA